MPTKLAVSLLIALALLVSGGTMRAEPSLSRDEGLMITRVLISLETTSPRASGAIEWRDLSEVIKQAIDQTSGVYQRDFAAARMVNLSTFIVLDYTLQLTRSDDKTHFQLSLTPTVPKSPKDDARLAWFTDDRGVIYTGRPLQAK